MPTHFISLVHRQAMVATQHDKQRLIAPIFEEALQWEFLPCPPINTDILGTFAGEIPRTLTPLEAARAKVALLPANTHATIFIANEGTFSPHPQIPFLQANIELLYIYDTLNQMEFYTYYLATDTAAFEVVFTTYETALKTAALHGFPTQAVILSAKTTTQYLRVSKGIDTWEQLERELKYLLQHYPTATLTIAADLRAMYCPARQEVIRLSAKKMLAELSHVCPQCQTPAFIPQHTEKGLPCEWCGNPTTLISKEITTCKRCAYTHTLTHHQRANPMYCDACNP